ncbi:hypothetical protein B0A48_02855 [Cryoendolithus antarcticus]|uniref:Uncharacterized protein n=1 Tax=Cryoendolithus antarcticus TaxID=1507870 RepID=A0A1V8TLN4_9PEZI|nr:hypothetical protein B0A48_02855 [Cryoendolithus antarcticus]
MSASAQPVGATTKGLETSAADGPTFNFANDRLADGAAGDLAATSPGAMGSSFANDVEQSNEVTPEDIATAVAAADALISEGDETAAGQHEAGMKVVTSIEQQFDSRLPTPSGLPDPTVDEDANVRIPVSQPANPSPTIDQEQEDPDAWITQPPPGPVHPPIPHVDPKETTSKTPPRYSPPALPRLANPVDDVDDPDPWRPHGSSKAPGDEHDISGHRQWLVRVKARRDEQDRKYLSEHRGKVRPLLNSD